MFKLSFFALLLLPLTASLFAQANASKQLVVILMGPPASGKGTQAARLSKELGILHISTGDLFRENIKNGTELGKKAKTYMDAGKLTPDELVLDMLFERISRPDAEKGYVLDGVPRTVAQAEALEKKLQNANVVILNLNVPDDIIIKRTSGRLICKSCGNVQNLYFSPPAKEGVCDKCSGELYQRPDDALNVVQERLRVYREQTEPVLAYYKKQNRVTDIDGNRNPDDVFNDLMKQIKK